MSADLVLEGAHVLTMDGAQTSCLLSVVIAGDRIAAVGEPAEIAGRFPDIARFDARRTIILPGLINAHLHPEGHLLRGSVDGLDLHGWRRAVDFQRAHDFLDTEAGEPFQRAAIRAAVAEALLSGTTCIATYGVTAGADAIAGAVLSEFGLHGHLTIRDMTFAPITDGPAHELSPPRMYRLHAEEELWPEELAAAAAATTRGERIVMHAAETRARVRLAQRRYGLTTVRLLNRFNLLSPRLLLSHAVHVDAEELDLLAAHGVAILASPAAEMKLADGIAPMTGYLRAGMCVALGTDSAVCNNGTDMLLEARLLGLSQALRYGAGAIDAMTLLRCATVHGALALGEQGERGTIAEGYAADLALIDARNTRLQPLLANASPDSVAANVVYSATGRDVRHVMVAGCWRVRDGRLVGQDEGRIADALGSAAAELADRLT
jgi:5-methylthioadenosine/S-adenosylhomocysteine deaminase